MRPLPHIWNESNKPAKVEPEYKPVAPEYKVKDESFSDLKITKDRENIKVHGMAKRERHDDVEEWFSKDLHHVGEMPASHNTTFTLQHNDGK